MIIFNRDYLDSQYHIIRRKRYILYTLKKDIGHLGNTKKECNES